MNNVKCRYVIFLVYIPSLRGSETMEPYVVGGDFTSILKFPHSVFLNIECESGWICGSSILNQLILLTAAHCVKGCSKNWNIEGYAGHEDLNKVVIVRSVDKFLIHEKYDERSMVNDIAILCLEEELPLGKYIQRVTIDKTQSYEMASVAGWGIVNRVTNADSMVLKQARQKLMTPKKCARYGLLVAGMMCARSPEQNTSPAAGDSGSALITKDLRQVGLVSFIFSEYPNTPIYTNVSFYFNWIRRNSRMLHCN